ncbi:winged helix-turn-helix transcriptional regulator [Kutzneria sp. CA-103260]|uniref:winged helix-turn-helix transcriptional regulator n=1 Tax=Kutzneria sp. CA-103260 TaxID=2802641 RepID=UPI001BEF0518|nr:helix-turn-helix domain-containing protein [Kutzneria sp. CA-103260]QUQ67074.1 cinnamoyl ester hydrolase [Kutzneria sp. CA-103260]
MTTQCQTGRHSDHDVYAAQCPCRAMLDLLANKWSALAIGALEDGPLRFGELQRCLQGISPKVLTQTLRRLEESDLVVRTVYPAVPLHVEYALTRLGLSAAVPLGLLRTWVEVNIDSVPAAQCESSREGVL